MTKMEIVYDYLCANTFFITWDMQRRHFSQMWPHHGRRMTRAEIWSINSHKHVQLNKKERVQTRREYEIPQNSKNKESYFQ